PSIREHDDDRLAARPVRGDGGRPVDGPDADERAEAITEDVLRARLELHAVARGLERDRAVDPDVVDRDPERLRRAVAHGDVEVIAWVHGVAPHARTVDDRAPVELDRVVADAVGAQVAQGPRPRDELEALHEHRAILRRREQVAIEFARAKA